MPIQTVQNCGAIGVVADVSPGELPINGWSDASNVKFVAGYAQRVGGYANVFSAPSITPYALFSYSALTKFFVHCGTQKVFVDDGTTRTEITPATPFSGAIDDRWTGGSFNGILILNNGIDQPQYWNGNVATDLANITGWNANWRCGFMRPYRNFLIAGDITKSGTRYSSLVKWSSLADPGALPASWDETNPAVEAGEQPLADSPDALVDALPLGDQMIVYKERGMYALQPSGDSSIFRFTRIPWDVGMLTRGCGAVTPLGHVVLTASDVILHNGGQPRSLVSDRMRKWLFDRIDQTNWKRCYVVANNNTSEVWVCFPEFGQSSCTKALIWNWLTDTFGVSTLPSTTCGAQGVAAFGSDTWAADTSTWNSDVTAWDQSAFGDTQTNLLMATTGPGLIAFEKSNDFAGGVVAASLTRKHLCIDGDPTRYKLLKAVRLRVDGPPGLALSVSAAGTGTADVEPTFSSTSTFTVGTSLKADVLASGRFHSLQITSSGTMPWRIKSMDLEYETQGMY